MGLQEKGLLIIDEFHYQAESKLKEYATSAASSDSINIQQAQARGKNIRCRDRNTPSLAPISPQFLYLVRFCHFAAE